MKCIIIYFSLTGNTELIAKTIQAGVKQAAGHCDIVKIKEANPRRKNQYDLIGFGSGIYYARHHSSLLSLIDKLPALKSKKVFIFHTSGLRKIRFFHEFDKALRKKLSEKGGDIIGEFACPGFDTTGLLNVIGGIKKNRPNKQDLEKARNFAKGLLKKLETNNKPA